LSPERLVVRNAKVVPGPFVQLNGLVGGAGSGDSQGAGYDSGAT